MWVGNVDFREAMVQGPQVMNRFSPMHQDDEGTFSSYEVDKELEEGIDGKCLTRLADITVCPRVSKLLHIYHELDQRT